MKTINYFDYKKPKKFWRDIQTLVKFDEDLEIYTLCDTFDELPGDIEYLIKQADKKNKLNFIGGCSLTSRSRDNIKLNNLAILLSKIVEPIEKKVVKDILKNNYIVSLFINDDAKASVKIDKPAY